MQEPTQLENELLDVVTEYTKLTRDTPEGVAGWGGKRKGSGRPSTGRERKIYYVTDEEHKALQKYLESLRKPSV
jgi:hypothetical protein